MKLKSPYLVKPHASVRLARLSASETGHFKTEKAADGILARHREHLDHLQAVDVGQRLHDVRKADVLRSRQLRERSVPGVVVGHARLQ